MRKPWRNAIASALLIAASLAARSSETLFGDAGVTRFPGGQNAYGGSLTFEQASSSGGILAGISGTDYPVGSLTFGSLDGFWIKSSALMLSAGLALGDATLSTQSSTLYKAHAALDAQVAPNWSVRVADQYIELDIIHGNLANVGLQYRPSKQWDASVTAAYALDGTLADRYGQLTANWYGAQHLFGGLIVGRTGYDPANLGTSAITRRLVETYLGAGLPIRMGTLTFTADYTSLDNAVRETLRVGFIEPIRP